MNVAILIAKGFEEIEAVTTFDILKRAGINVITVALDEKDVTGSRGLRIAADMSIGSLPASGLDALVVPGGYPGHVNLANNGRVLNLIREMNRAGKHIASICAGPLVLEKAGILEGKSVTCYPGTETGLKSGKFSPEKVVVDGNIITSRGPGTAVDFALKLVEVLLGADTAEKLRSDLVA